MKCLNEFVDLFAYISGARKEIFTSEVYKYDIQNAPKHLNTKYRKINKVSKHRRNNSVKTG